VGNMANAAAMIASAQQHPSSNNQTGDVRIRITAAFDGTDDDSWAPDKYVSLIDLSIDLGFEETDEGYNFTDVTNQNNLGSNTSGCNVGVGVGNVTSSYDASCGETTTDLEVYVRTSTSDVQVSEGSTRSGSLSYDGKFGSGEVGSSSTTETSRSITGASGVLRVKYRIIHSEGSSSPEVIRLSETDQGFLNPMKLTWKYSPARSLLKIQESEMTLWQRALVPLNTGPAPPKMRVFYRN
ncbi:MAG: hypothetical protein KDC43_27710, partial [Saprospiraceae bacterium]|nr:hypothetical protein [Saprospiraceae bacterium]